MIGPSQFELWIGELSTDSKGTFNPVAWVTFYDQMDLYEIRVAEAVGIAQKDNLRVGGEFIGQLKPKRGAASHAEDDTNDQPGGKRSGTAALLLQKLKADRAAKRRQSSTSGEGSSK